MTNFVIGSVVDDAQTPVPVADLIVIVYQTDLLSLFDDKPLGSGRTNSAGTFSINYEPRLFTLALRVRVFDPVKRLLAVSQVFTNVTPTFNLPAPISVHRRDVDGWLVTGLTGVPQMLTTGNTITTLIDNAAAWGALTDAVRAATGSVRLLLHYFDVTTVFTKFDPPYDPPEGYEGTPATGDRLEDALLAVNRDFNVSAWLTLNDFPLPWADTAGAMEDFLEAQHDLLPHTVGYARFKIPQVAPMHAKIAVVVQPTGARGFIPASGLIQEYYDDRVHRVDDPRRGTMGRTNFICVPVHDVSAVVDGPAVNDMDHTVRLHWDSVHPTQPIEPLPPHPSPNPPTASAIQVVRTLMPDRFPAPYDKGETGILEAYQRAFRNATDYIYIETQYFTEPVVGESLILALRNRPSLVAILLININVDVPFYNTWQQILVNAMLHQAHEEGFADRIGVFCLWSHEPGEPRHRIIRNYVHSKMALADDRWATIGSANIEGTGLNRAQHISFLPESYPFITRGVEANIVVYDGLDGLPPSTYPRDLRRDLWAEHLGYSSPTHPDLVNRPAGPRGWLDLWNARATAKRDALKADPPSTHPARILRWLPYETTNLFLSAQGLNRRRFIFEDRVRDFDLTTGTWK